MEELIEVLVAILGNGIVVEKLDPNFHPHGYRIRLDLDEGKAEQEQPTHNPVTW